MKSGTKVASVLVIVLALLAYAFIFHTWTTITLSGLAFLALITGNIIKHIKPVFTDDPTLTSTNKAVFITGCDTGFGNALARRLDQCGYMVFAGCLFSTQEPALSLEKNTSQIHILQLDVTNKSDIDAALKSIVDVLNKNGKELWAVVNNAGIAGMSGPLEWNLMDKVEKVLEINSLAPVKVVQTFLPLLRKSRGRIVNVASAAGRVSVPNLIPYCMSKHAMVALSEGLRLELKPFGISVSSIEPTFYKTGITDMSAMTKVVREEFYKLDESVRAVYGDAFLNAYLDSINSGRLKSEIREDISEVIRAMEHAITSQYPRFAYAPPEPFFPILRSILQSLPLGVSDWILLRNSPTKSLQPALQVRLR